LKKSVIDMKICKKLSDLNVWTTRIK